MAILKDLIVQGTTKLLNKLTLISSGKVKKGDTTAVNGGAVFDGLFNIDFATFDWDVSFNFIIDSASTMESLLTITNTGGGACYCVFLITTPNAYGSSNFGVFSADFVPGQNTSVIKKLFGDTPGYIKYDKSTNGRIVIAKSHIPSAAHISSVTPVQIKVLAVSDKSKITITPDDNTAVTGTWTALP